MANLTLETKTKDDLTLESKDMELTWDTATGNWKEQKGTWSSTRASLELEDKTKDDLTLESKQ